MLGIKALGAVAGSGCGIREVVPFGSGDASGLRGGDLITSVADETIVSFEDLVDELRRFNTGDTIDLTIRRFGPVVTAPGNKKLKLSVTLRSWKDYVNATNQAAADYEAAAKKPESKTAVESPDE
jgi:S1-C subfamily serine protease